MGHDFAGTAAAALASALVLLPKWMGGRRQGDEWVGERRANGGIGNSWSVNLMTGTWKHFAGTVSGKDLISLYAELYHVSMNTARLEIDRELGVNGNDVPVLPARAPVPVPRADDPVELIPHDAPPLTEHPTRGQPTAEYRYGDHFVVQRFDFIDAGGEPDKTFVQWSWHDGAWRKRGTRAPRPLYHAHLLKASPGAPVLVVEGEKCVELAAPLLPYHTLTTWSGGASAWRHSDWSVLKGCEVLLWPDADDVGRKAAAEIGAHLHGIAQRVRVVNPNGADPGWDIGDAIEKDGWSGPQLIEFMRDHSAPQIEGAKEVRNAPSSETRAALPSPRHLETTEQSALVTLASLGLECVKDVPVPSLANVSKILQAHPIFKGHIWFDDFRGATYHTLRGPTPVRWTDAETRALTVNIQQQLRLPKFTSRIVEEGLQHAAECNRRNSLTAWLNSLPEWDGMERLDMWLADCAGVEFNDYSKAVAANWLIGMVARAYQPGCKMDNMPVLEGASGLSKTSLLEALGDEWYKPLPMEFGSKDFLQALRGAWLVEIPDMTGFGKVAHSAILATLTIRNDTYRAPYGREPQEYARTCVFAATSETDDYLSDTRGKRRYWPLRCTDINLDGLRATRRDLFAEAIFRYRRGDHWYEMPQSTSDEQLARASDEPWQQPILQTAQRWWEVALQRGDGFREITAKNLLSQSMSLEVGKLTPADCRRVAAILRGGGWNKKTDKEGSYWVWRERNALL